MPDNYKQFSGLRFETNQPVVLEVVFDGPNLNAVDATVHAQLPALWPVVDADPDVRVVLVRGAGSAFPAGGSFALIDEQIADYGVRMRVMQEARDLFDNIINFSSRSSPPFTGVSPLLCGMAKAKYLLLTCREISGEDADRVGLVSIAVDEDQLLTTAREIAGQLSGGAQEALRWTKSSLNRWYRMHGPIFDASLGMEFIGFGGPDVREGVASHRERRAPNFSGA